MDIGSIFLTLALLIGVSLLIARPLMNRKLETQPLLTRQAARRQEQERSGLLAQKEHILSTIQELDIDYSQGKVPEEDYPVQRSELLQAGAEILKQLDALAPDLSGLKAGVNGVGKLSAASSLPTPGEDELEALIAARRRDRMEKAVGFCPKCGSPLQKTDKFCPRCGADTQK